jgi:hypothetical protein
MLGSVHRLDLGVPLIELFQGPYPEQLAIVPNAEERDVRGQEAGEVEHMDVLRRAVLIGEGKVRGKKRLNILGFRIIDPDNERVPSANPMESGLWQ